MNQVVVLEPGCDPEVTLYWWLLKATVVGVGGQAGQVKTGSDEPVSDGGQRAGRRAVGEQVAW